MAQNCYIIVFIVISKLLAKTNYSVICLQVGAIGQWSFAGKILIKHYIAHVDNQQNGGNRNLQMEIASR